MRYILVLIPFLAGCEHVQPLSARDKALEVIFQSANAIDAEQTSRIKDYPYLVEGEPITKIVIGERPSDRNTLLYFAGIGIAHFLFVRALPPKVRPWFQGITIINTGSAIKRNKDNGL